MNCFLALPNLTCHCICFRDFKKEENIVGWKWRSDVTPPLSFPSFFPRSNHSLKFGSELAFPRHVFILFLETNIHLNAWFLHVFKPYVMVTYIYACVCVTQKFAFLLSYVFETYSTDSCIVFHSVNKPQLMYSSDAGQLACT